MENFYFESALDTVKKELNPNLFDAKENLKTFVKDFILDKIEKWLEKNLPKHKLTQAVLLGSSLTYQYTDTSDIDVNIILDPMPTKEQLKEVGLPNGENLPHTKQPINYYFQTEKKALDQADGTFNLLKNEWIKKPKKDEVKIPFSYVVEIAKFFMIGIDNKIMEYESDVKELEHLKTLLEEENQSEKKEIQERISFKEEEILSDLDTLYIAHRLAKSFRKEAFDETFNTTYLIKIESTSPNFSINNLVYKVLEKFGYFEKLQKYEEIRKQKKG